MRPLWILHPMVSHFRIEVWAGRSESWPFTVGDLVDVYSAFAGRQALEVERDRYARTALAFANCGGANALSLRIPQFHHDRFLRSVQSGCGGQSDNDTN